MTPVLRVKNVRLYLLIGGLLCFLSYITLYTVAPDKKKDDMRESLPGSVSLQVKNVHFTQVDNAGVAWEISADTATLMKAEEKSKFENMRVKLTSNDGAVYTLTSQKGSLRTDSKDITMDGNVVIVSDMGSRFETDHLDYSHAQKNVHTKSAIAIMTPFINIKGSGMSLDLKEKKLTIFSGVRAQLKQFDNGQRRT